MQSKVAPFAATPDSTYGRQTPPPAHELVVAAENGDAAEEADLRLVIEEDTATGVIVYKRVDRQTGRVVAEFSRDLVMQMMGAANYAAGELIRTKA